MTRVARGLRRKCSTILSSSGELNIVPGYCGRFGVNFLQIGCSWVRWAWGDWFCSDLLPFEEPWRHRRRPPNSEPFGRRGAQCVDHAVGPGSLKRCDKGRRIIGAACRAALREAGALLKATTDETAAPLAGRVPLFDGGVWERQDVGLKRRLPSMDAMGSSALDGANCLSSLRTSRRPKKEHCSPPDLRGPGFAAGAARSVIELIGFGRGTGWAGPPAADKICFTVTTVWRRAWMGAAARLRLARGLAGPRPPVSPDIPKHVDHATALLRIAATSGTKKALVRSALDQGADSVAIRSAGRRSRGGATGQRPANRLDCHWRRLAAVWRMMFDGRRRATHRQAPNQLPAGAGWLPVLNGGTPRRLHAWPQARPAARPTQPGAAAGPGRPPSKSSPLAGQAANRCHEKPTCRE